LDSVSLPGEFHRDPADRLIVALARKLDAELVTADRKILAYSSVKAIAAD
jgi:PIN domain nuclease of toxin-antitoxin system